MEPGIVIVGAGIAGITSARTLRNLGYPNKITLVSDEPGLPYKRTHLTKQLYRKIVPGEFTTYTQENLNQLGIEYIDHTPILKIDLDHRCLSTSDQENFLEFTKLILATGSLPKQSAQLMKSFPVYREHHVHQLQAELANRPNELVHVVGGGILGVEVAEQLIRMGRRVNLYCEREFPMIRELPNQLGLLLKQLLITQGVNLVSSNSFPDLTSSGLVVSALGVEPNIKLAQTCGLPWDKGILVNEYLETPVKGVYALGDCAQLPDGSISHLWHQAESQGEYIAKRILGDTKGFQSIPFRTKAEVFGQLIFSCGSIMGITSNDYYIEGQNLSLWARVEEDRTKGLAFVGERDKSFAKTGQKAVREQWPLHKVRELALS